MLTKELLEAYRKKNPKKYAEKFGYLDKKPEVPVQPSEPSPEPEKAPEEAPKRKAKEKKEKKA